MILSRGRRYLFVHAPKTGGTSMALALEARAMKDDIMVGDTPKAQRRRKHVKDVATHGRLWKHSTLADLGGLVRAEELDDLLIFTTVRNPWDRMVSYYHWLRDQAFDHTAVQLAKTSSFEDFVAARQINDSFRAAPLASYVTDRAGVMRGRLFIRLEHLRTDIVPLERHLGFSLDVPHVNQSDRARDYRSFYSERSRLQVAQMCAEDIAQFDYRFEA